MRSRLGEFRVAFPRAASRPSPDRQRRNIAAVARAIAPLIRDHRVVITHGNGPRIGLLPLQAAGSRLGRATPLDVPGTESEGLIG